MLLADLLSVALLFEEVVLPVVDETMELGREGVPFEIDSLFFPFVLFLFDEPDSVLEVLLLELVRLLGLLVEVF